MDNPESIFQMLEVFSKIKSREIPRELEEYISYVARTGDPVFQWSLVKVLLREKLLLVLDEFVDSNPSLDIPQCPNVDAFSYESMKTMLLERLESFELPPFTIQRLCELLSMPRKEYNRIDKYMRAVEKNILVVSPTELCFRRGLDNDNNESMLNGILYDKMNDSLTNYPNVYAEDSDDVNLSEKLDIAENEDVQRILNEPWGDDGSEFIGEPNEAIKNAGFENDFSKVECPSKSDDSAENTASSSDSARTPAANLNLLESMIADNVNELLDAEKLDAAYKCQHTFDYADFSEAKNPVEENESMEMDDELGANNEATEDVSSSSTISVDENCDEKGVDDVSEEGVEIDGDDNIPADEVESFPEEETNTDDESVVDDEFSAVVESIPDAELAVNIAESFVSTAESVSNVLESVAEPVAEVTGSVTEAVESTWTVAEPESIENTADSAEIVDVTSTELVGVEYTEIGESMDREKTTEIADSSEITESVAIVSSANTVEHEEAMEFINDSVESSAVDMVESLNTVDSVYVAGSLADDECIRESSIDEQPIMESSEFADSLMEANVEVQQDTTPAEEKEQETEADSSTPDVAPSVEIVAEQSSETAVKATEELDNAENEPKPMNECEPKNEPASTNEENSQSEQIENVEIEGQQSGSEVEGEEKSNNEDSCENAV